MYFQVILLKYSDFQKQHSQSYEANPDFTTDKADSLFHDLVMPKLSDTYHKSLERTVSKRFWKPLKALNPNSIQALMVSQALLQ